MATGAEHYLEAECLLELAEAYIPDGPDHTSCIARAQVHATLALAAATAAAAEGPGVILRGYGDQS